MAHSLKAINDIIRERGKQVGKGYTVQKDARYTQQELIQAAMCHAYKAHEMQHCLVTGEPLLYDPTDKRCDDSEPLWPFHTGWKTYPTARDHLRVAATFLVAQMDVLDLGEADRIDAELNG